MNPNRILIALLAFGAVLSGYLEFLDMKGIPEPEIVQVGSMIAFSVLIFAWYRFDSDIRGYKRSPLLNVSVVAIGILAVPYYLVRSRERGERLKALKLNPSNVVLFSNDVEAVPVELELWPREGTTYLLLKEHNFGTANERIANAFLVASLVNAAISGDEQRLHPRLVCRFVLK